MKAMNSLDQRPYLLRVWTRVQWLAFAIVLVASVISYLDITTAARLTTLLFVPGLVLALAVLFGLVTPAWAGKSGGKLNLLIDIIISSSFLAGAWINAVFYIGVPLVMAWRVHKLALAIRRRLPWREDLRQNA